MVLWSDGSMAGLVATDQPGSDDAMVFGVTRGHAGSVHSP